MVSGRRAFKRKTTAETMTTILKEDPPLLSEVTLVSPGLARIVRRCLEKSPEQRFTSARDLAFALEALGEISGASPATEPMPIARSSTRRRVVASLLILGGFAAAFLAGRLAVDSDPAETVRVHRLTDAPGLEESPAMSPDGRSVAYVRSAEGSRHAFVRLLAGGTSLQLTRGAGEHLFPRWAPDSSSLVYYAPGLESGEPGAIWEIPALGGTARRVASATSGADISPDGQGIAFFRLENGHFELVLTERDGSNARAIAQVEPGYRYLAPRFSPDGNLIAYYRKLDVRSDIFVVPRSGGVPRRVTHDDAWQEGFTWSRSPCPLKRPTGLPSSI